ncbi:MAG: DNA polymerase III subunit alpha [Planctomycetota bacterium]
MSRPEFVHLHVHTEYSLLDGANRIADLVQACLDDGQPALAITDHGNLFGAVEHYERCRKAGIKPIIGCEVYVARETRLQPYHKRDNPYSHLTLLARTLEGWRNLLKLATAAYLEGFHFRPRIDRELLARHGTGLSCLSGCLSGEVNQLFARGRAADAARAAAELRDIFGPEHFWIEIQRNGIEVQAAVNESLVDLSRRTAIPLVATNDIHYLRHEDCTTQDVLLCINTGARRRDADRWRMDTDTLYFTRREEMGQTFRDLPDSLRTTLDVAEQVDVDLGLGGEYHLPVFVPDGGEDPGALFERLCEEGLRRRYGPDHAEARERLEYEKRVIREMGLVSYFLIVWDLIRWARENGIPVGPGRGSAAGSIVAYALDITRVCPLAYDLLFERFLNSARISMPDIDIDFCKEGRERVLQYTRERYGAANVAQIGTFATLASRSVVRDVGRVLDIPLGEVDRLAKMIPQGQGAPPLAEALEKDPQLREVARDERYRELFALSKKLDGSARHISTHAAGVVIADRPIVDYVPLCTTKEDVVTQFPGPQLEKLGLLKMDYLGLRTLTIIAKTLENVARTGGTPPDVDQLPLADEATFALLNRGDTLGVFQLESEGMRKLIVRLRPDCFEDLIAVLALYRPGPLESGMDDMFIRRKHGLEDIDYPHPSLEEILRDTHGCIVYQEQVMRISNVLGNFSLNDADNLRKAMGKKKPEIMARFAEKFIAGALSNGCTATVAREIWEKLDKFGGYGFNKSHSTAYALITWRTAWLKAHHRIEFLAANMSCEMNDSDTIKAFADDARAAGIRILPPDIERSAWEFLPEGGAVRFGFGAIKGTGEKAIEALVAGRERLQRAGQALSLHALCGHIDPHAMTRLAWEVLIKAGCFDGSTHNRGAVLAALDAALAEGARAADDRRSGQMSMFGDPAEMAAAHGDGVNDRHALSRTDTLRMEREVLGFYLSGHPLESRAGVFEMLSSTNTRDLTALPGGAEVTVGGLIVNFKETTTRAGKRMARFRIEDMVGSVPVVCFPRTLEECRHLLADDAMVIIRARLEQREEDDDSSAVGLLLEGVSDVDSALDAFGGVLVIRLAPADRARLPELARLLALHPGRSRVFFEVEGDDGRPRRVRTNGQQGVRIDGELTRALEQLLGKGKARLARS